MSKEEDDLERKIQDEELDRTTEIVAGSNPDWFNVDKATLMWLVTTVQRLMMLDEQAIEEWNLLVQTHEFNLLTRQLGEEFNHQKVIGELNLLAQDADIEESHGNNDDEAYEA